jgi:hypothetical protein
MGNKIACAGFLAVETPGPVKGIEMRIGAFVAFLAFALLFSDANAEVIVRRVAGKATMLKGGGKPKKLSRGAKIRDGWQVETGTNGVVDLELVESRSMLRIRQGSVLRIEKEVKTRRWRDGISTRPKAGAISYGDWRDGSDFKVRGENFRRRLRRAHGSFRYGR